MNQRTPYYAAFVLLFVLTACGFEPLHSRAYQANQSVQLAALDVVVNNSRRGQLLEAEIEDALAPDLTTAEKLYQLRITLAEREVDLFINPDGTSSRGDFELYSSYRLTRIIDGALVDQGSIKRVASFNTSENANSGYASFVSLEDAKKRTTIELAHDYKLRMANLLNRLNRESALPL